MKVGDAVIVNFPYKTSKNEYGKLLAVRDGWDGPIWTVLIFGAVSEYTLILNQHWIRPQHIFTQKEFDFQ